MIPIAYTPRIDRPHWAVILCAPRGLVLAPEVAMKRWQPKQETTRQEEFLLKRLHRTRKLFGFLRRHRNELFDEQFQSELEGMYRASGSGQEPVAPALLAMVVLLQSYTGISDAEAVELSVVDLRWQMVLGCLGAGDPPFSQGALPAFRERLIAHDMDRRLLVRTVELARATKEFDWKKLPKVLRVAIDSSPLEGAGRVKDTLNLLAHAARKVVECAADLLQWSPDRVCREARAPLPIGPSVKAAPPSTSPKTSNSSSDSASSTPRRAVVPACVRASARSTGSHTSPAVRAAALVTAACARTCSTYDGPRPSRTWKPYTARWRDEISFNLFSALGLDWECRTGRR